MAMSLALQHYKSRAFSAIQSSVSKLTDKISIIGPTTYNEDGLTTVHAAPFLDDPLFHESYELGRATGSWRGTEIRWRCFICCWAAWHAHRLKGDFVECGVNRGGYSRAIMHYTDFPSSGKRLFLLDTFSGLADQYISESERALGRAPGGYDECYEDVVKTFEGFPVRIIRGPVPETLPQVDAQAISYLSLDMNCAEPESAAIRYFWPRLVRGGVVVHDDYGFAGMDEQRHAMDDFATEVHLKMMQLPTGQALLFKP